MCSVAAGRRRIEFDRGRACRMCLGRSRSEAAQRRLANSRHQLTAKPNRQFSCHGLLPYLLGNVQNDGPPLCRSPAPPGERSSSLSCPRPLKRPAHDPRQARRPIRRFTVADRVTSRAVGNPSVVVRRRTGALAPQLLHAGSDHRKIIGSAGTRGSGEHRSQTRKGGYRDRLENYG